MPRTCCPTQYDYTLFWVGWLTQDRVVGVVFGALGGGLAGERAVRLDAELAKGPRLDQPVRLRVHVAEDRGAMHLRSTKPVEATSDDLDERTAFCGPPYGVDGRNVERRPVVKRPCAVDVGEVVVIEGYLQMAFAG
eukprot:6152462-Prymnesium_polylepis.2